MKRIWIPIVALIVGACSPKEVHFLSDEGYRAAVEEALEERLSAHDGALRPFCAIPEDATLREKEALEFLYAYMPLADLTDYPTAFYLDNVRAALRTAEEMGWNVPEREFRHFVLPLRVNNENLDSSRVVFYRELKPRVEGLPMREAILEVNHWCHEKLTYQPSDARTLSPLGSLKNALGRCGEESTFCVAALRSVGIPARQVYTPRWAHTDDNHAWVEAWADGQWYFMGACEPEPVLNLGWFNAPASRAMLMHTKVFGRYDGPEEKVLESPNYTEINLIDNYAKTAKVDFTVVDGDGAPVEGARVDFCIYNYAEFYPALSKYTDAEGRTSLSAGLGDLLVWASKEGAFGYKKASFGKDGEVRIEISPLASLGRNDNPSFRGLSVESVTVVPPPEGANIPPVTPEQRAENDRRFAREDSLRHAYEATFPTHDEALAFVQGQGYGHHMAAPILASRGNWETIEAFMPMSGNHERVEQVLTALSGKDLKDAPLEVLQDYYAADRFLGARVENEFLTPFYGYFREHFTDAVASPEALVEWVRNHVTVLDSPLAWNIPMSPAAVFESGLALPRSRDIFFVSLARALGFEAQKDPVTGKVQYRQDGEWFDVHFDGAPAAKAPTGILRLSYSPTRAIPNPGYYSHFTISRLVSGRPRLLTFDEGEVDMGGGVDWEHVFRSGYPLETGQYLLVSGNRSSDGSVPVTMKFFSVKEGETTTVDLVIREEEGKVGVIGSFDAESLYAPVPDQVGHDDSSFHGAGHDDPSFHGLSVESIPRQSVLSAVGRGFYALAVVEPGKEPTNHFLRDLAAVREAMETWGRPILLLTESKAAMEKLTAEIRAGRYGKLPATVLFGIDTGGIRGSIKSSGGLAAGSLPVVILADSFNRVFFSSEGYSIGLGARLCDVINRL